MKTVMFTVEIEVNDDADNGALADAIIMGLDCNEDFLKEERGLELGSRLVTEITEIEG